MVRLMLISWCCLSISGCGKSIWLVVWIIGCCRKLICFVILYCGRIWMVWLRMSVVLWSVILVFLWWLICLLWIILCLVCIVILWCLSVGSFCCVRCLRKWFICMCINILLNCLVLMKVRFLMCIMRLCWFVWRMNFWFCLFICWWIWFLRLVCLRWIRSCWSCWLCLFVLWKVCFFMLGLCRFLYLVVRIRWWVL